MSVEFIVSNIPFFGVGIFYNCFFPFFSYKLSSILSHFLVMQKQTVDRVDRVYLC